MSERPRGLLFPLILVVLGVLLLLANFGYLPPFSWRALFQLWPAILIAVGVDLVFGRRRPLIAFALELVVIAAALFLAFTQPASLFGTSEAGQTTATVERGSARTLALRVSGGAGAYTVAGGADQLVDVRAEEGQVRVSTIRHGDGVDVRVEPAGFGDVFPFGARRLDVRVLVARDAPTSIRLDGGAGDFTLDMRDIRVTDARVSTGASSIRVVLPRPSGDVPVRIVAGAASVEIEVPQDVEASVVTRGGAISFNSLSPRLGASGGAASTAGYASATDRVTVTVEAGASSVTVR